MQRTLDERSVTAGDDRLLSIRCSQCGGTIGKSKELIADGKLFYCEACYQTLVNPDGGGDVPSRWV